MKLKNLPDTKRNLSRAMKYISLGHTQIKIKCVGQLIPKLSNYCNSAPSSQGKLAKSDFPTGIVLDMRWKLLNYMTFVDFPNLLSLHQKLLF